MNLNEFVEANGDYWQGEHPEFPVDDWIAEVRNGDTRKGYWEWAYAQVEGED